MEKSMTRSYSLANSFWLALLLHIMLLIFFSTVIIFPLQEKNKTPNLYVPSYVYTGKITPSVQPSRPVQQQSSSTQENIQKTIPSAKNGIKPKSTTASPRSMLAATYSTLQNEQRQSITTSLKNSDPIYLVGEENSFSDPLIKLIGRSLSAHFEYPKMAGEFGIKGRVLIGLTLHPEGYFTDVQMLQSSHNEDLDAAALYAVNAAPTVVGADRFISAPKHFVIGFIFR